MRSHPDADAFVRAFLRDPKDETTRLVFADWLEETGQPHNAAWAGYIRAKASAARYEFGSPEWRAADREAGRFADHVRADLRLPVGFFLQYPASLLRLIPGPNITVRLCDGAFTESRYALMPESVAREAVAFPLLEQRPVLVVAMHRPQNADDIRRIESRLGRDVVAVRADLDDLLAAVNREYGRVEIESVDASYEAPLIGLEGDSDSGACGTLFVLSFMRQAAGFELEHVADEVRVNYLPAIRPRTDGVMSATAFRRLLDHLSAQPVDRRSAVNGLLRREVDVPLLSGRRFPVDFEVRPGERSPRWLRVVFRWERAYPEPPPRRRRL